jgi:hypothetical protein
MRVRRRRAVLAARKNAFLLERETRAARPSALPCLVPVLVSVHKTRDLPPPTPRPPPRKPAANTKALKEKVEGKEDMSECSGIMTLFPMHGQVTGIEL